MNDEKVFSIETNTTDSHFSRRYDPAKYEMYFDKRKSRELVSKNALSSRQGRGDGTPFLTRSLSNLLTCLTFSSFVASRWSHQGNYPGCSHDEEPDSKVVAAPWSVLQPCSERWSIANLFRLDTAARRLRTVILGSRKYTIRTCFAMWYANFLIFIHSWSPRNYNPINGRTVSLLHRSVKDYSMPSEMERISHPF